MRLRESKILVTLWKEFHFEGPKYGWDPRTFQHTSLPFVLNETEVTPYYQVDFEKPATYDLQFGSYQLSAPKRELDGISISAPIYKSDNVWSISWEVDWDFSEFSLKAGSFFELEIKAEMIRNTKEFPKFDPKKTHSLVISASSMLDNFKDVVQYYSNPEYRVWLGHLVGFIKPKVEDYSVELTFHLDIEKGDVPPGYMEFVMFMTLRSARPQLSVALPGLDLTPEDYMEQSFVRRAFAREM